MLVVLLVIFLISYSGAAAAPAPQSEAKASEEFLSKLTQYVTAGQLDQAREAMRQDLAGSKAALQTLVTQFDGSVHSFRNRPEQRRVQYSDTLLDTGLKLSQILQELSGDNAYMRRFEARRDRMAATKLLNDKQYQKAMDLIQSVRKTALELEDKSFLFSTYLTSAYAHLGLGKGEQALANCETALRIARETGDPAKNALALFNLGTAYLHLGKTADSLPFSTQAAEAAEKVGNKLWAANAWLNVGSAEMILRRYEPGEKALQRTLTLAREVGDKLAEGRAYYDLGVLYHNWGRWQPASENLERSLEFIRTVDIRHSHDIEPDGYNYVEKDALELLVRSYQKMNREDATATAARARLEELKALPKKDTDKGHDRQGHSH